MLTGMIDVRKLEILRELDRCGTIAATAQAVHLTPSAVSQQFAALSRETGTAMLEPDGRRVRLTEAARLLLSHAHAIFTHLEHARVRSRGLPPRRRRHRPAGHVQLRDQGIAVPVLSDLATRTRLRVELREVEPEDAFDGLLSRTSTCRWCCRATPSCRVRTTNGWSRAPAGRRDGRGPAVRPSAGGPAEIELADLADADWIIARPGVPCRQLTWDACERAGFVPRARHYADEFMGWSGWSRPGTASDCCPGSPSRSSRTSPSSFVRRR